MIRLRYIKSIKINLRYIKIIKSLSFPFLSLLSFQLSFPIVSEDPRYLPWSFCGPEGLRTTRFGEFGPGAHWIFGSENKKTFKRKRKPSSKYFYVGICFFAGRCSNKPTQLIRVANLLWSHLLITEHQPIKYRVGRVFIYKKREQGVFVQTRATTSIYIWPEKKQTKERGTFCSKLCWF